MNLLYTLKKITGLAVLMLSTMGLFSQEKLTKKQLRDNFIKDSLKIIKPKLVRAQFRIDNRNIFFKGQSLNINGYDAGVLLKEKLRVTLGYYTLNNKLSAYSKTVGDDQYEREVRMNYATLNTEFIYKNTRFFSLGMPLEFGLGNNRLQYINSKNEPVEGQQSGFIFLTDFGLSATFKPIRWFGLKMLFGYRKTAYNQVKDFNFDGIFTSIGLNVDVREIIRDIKLYKLRKRYDKDANGIETAVDIITN